MKKIFIIIPLFLGGFLFSQKKPLKRPVKKTAVGEKFNYNDEFKKISDEIMTNGTAYENLGQLTKGIGPRFSATPGYMRAVDWAEKKLKEIGIDMIWKMEAKAPVWIRGKESLQIKTANGDWKNIRMLSFGNSEGTGGKDLTGEIVLINSTSELNAMSVGQLKDKIVFVNLPMDPKIINTSDSYLITAKSKLISASVIAKTGAKALIIRSLTTASDDTPHAKMVYYEPDDKIRIPALSIGVKSADELEKLLKSQKVTAKLNMTAQSKGDTTNPNIIAEIQGKKDSKVIVLGAQLDSWDFGEGAIDDGTGVAQCIEVLRTFKALGLENNHTIRVVFYANSENGGQGREMYAAYVKKKDEKHIFALGTDAGGYSPRGFSLDMSPQRRKQIFEWKNYFLPYGVYDFDQTEAIQDISPLKKMDIPLAELVVDTQRYFDYHHSEQDTFDKVNKRELLLGAVAMTQMIFMIDKNW
ncbi:M20/M25/M40 family metallo-hydrolase [Chryseobacterium gambrini]|uniref:Carboxypeptidase Q n=1 Tax=Chryseobacterium gambrini TaxID=373672 RepID=A0AAJ1R111_9FLAO|nr:MULTISPECIES: M20/M25/M40 family metallo-hydrolase [Chryseobacterium]MDN4010885.1 M20/M25/M40 family metallo-hydrolase [Chryseobacterium gambrini]MDN4028503.1 M20/M25/M40 family metallo-hydrolase [Chryseobacterium gambrini]QWA38984.1 M20/M25/M40 family metallo-hydrolase [Chryseobacterium sp. ZHDP1]